MDVNLKKCKVARGRLAGNYPLCEPHPCLIRQPSVTATPSSPGHQTQRPWFKVIYTPSSVWPRFLDTFSRCPGRTDIWQLIKSLEQLHEGVYIYIYPCFTNKETET